MIKKSKNLDFISWDRRYSLGIHIIDDQHKELLRLTNTLYRACRQKQEFSRKCFRDAMQNAVKYIKVHFSTEEKIMEKINYPDMTKHKFEHQEFVKKVLSEAANFDEGQTFVPNRFVYFLKDWVLGHIAMTDRKMAEYLFEMKKEGRLNSFLQPKQSEHG